MSKKRNLAEERAQRPGLRRVWDELFRRMGSSARPVVSISLNALDQAEQVAIADLLGRDRLPGSVVQLRTDAIARALGLDDDELRALVEALRGPLPNRAAERSAKKQERAELWEWLRTRVTAKPLAEWVERVRLGGIPQGDVPGLRARLEQVASILDRLPEAGVVLSVLARDQIGDPHGLDWGKWTTNRILDAIATLHGLNPPVNAEEARALWDRVGVVPDQHSIGVTILGLRPNSSGPLASALTEMSAQGEPYTITLSQLRRWPVAVDPGSVHLFENASVLSYAAGMSWAGPPLVCTAGWPNTAVFILCHQLRQAGCELLHHGDFDPSGIDITRYLMDRASVRPWRMSKDDYIQLAVKSDTQLVGTVGPTPWDPDLAAAMEATGKVVYEEDCVGELLAFLLPRRCQDARDPA